MWAAWSRRQTYRPEEPSKSKKHDEIRVLAESKLNSSADRISIALNDDKISDEEFHLVLSEIDKYNQMKEEIRERQKQGGKKKLLQRARDEAMIKARTRLLEELHQDGNTGTSQ